MLHDNFESKVAVVTGAAQGLGLGIAQALAARGAHVVLSDINEDVLRAAAASIDGAEAVRCDVRDEADQTALIDGIVERHGRLDVAVANAGVGNVKPMVEMSLADWREVTSVNLDGVFLTAKLAGAVMAEQGSGSIVTLGSITALTGSGLIAHYAAAKAGVVSLSKTLATELRDAGVRVNCVCPGFADTAIVRDNEATFDEALPDGVTLDSVIVGRQGRWGREEDVAAAVCFLAGERSPWITGVTLTVDGGWRASLL
jgi:NAD(P)-dependent dehydrogenase (short-subunit alcohol dehydrogenase family)